MYSLPWMPSRVGLTISDMSVPSRQNQGRKKVRRNPRPTRGSYPSQPGTRYLRGFRASSSGRRWFGTSGLRLSGSAWPGSSARNGNNPGRRCPENQASGGHRVPRLVHLVDTLLFHTAGTLQAPFLPGYHARACHSRKPVGHGGGLDVVFRRHCLLPGLDGWPREELRSFHNLCNGIFPFNSHDVHSADPFDLA